MRPPLSKVLGLVEMISAHNNGGHLKLITEKNSSISNLEFGGLSSRENNLSQMSWL